MSELVNNAKSEVYAQCDECMTTDGWLCEIAMDYEHGATLCRSCAENIVADLKDAEKEPQQ